MKIIIIYFIAVESTDHFGEHVFCKHTLGLQLYNLKIYFFFDELSNTQMNVKRISSHIFYMKNILSLTGYKNLLGRVWVGFFFILKNEIMKLVIVLKI